MTGAAARPARRRRCARRGAGAPGRRSRSSAPVVALALAAALLADRRTTSPPTLDLGRSGRGRCCWAAITLLRVVVLIALASLVWVPVGVWLGLRPAWARRVQPVAQFLAAFPANLLFPPFVVVIVRFHLNPDVFLTPLMVLGTQWYILFNVIAGAAAFPGDLQEAAQNFRVGGLAVVAPGDPARHPALLRHRRHHRLGRLVERRHRRRGGLLGRHQAGGARARRLHRPGHRRRRLPRASCWAWW